MSVRRQAFVRNLLAMPSEAIQRHTRVLLKREQDYAVGGQAMVPPPESRLPYYQWRDPTYDVYAADLLAAACAGRESATLIDIGGNVGDTAVLALSAADNLSVVSVEGSPYFLNYLRRNTAPFGQRGQIIAGFVGPVAGLHRYSRDGDTGGFQRSVTGADESIDVASWISVPELLQRASDDLVIWKTDTDGFDIHLMVQHWEAITNHCRVIWMEFDPVGTLGPSDDVATLINLIAESGRELHVYDNVGHHMCSASGEAAARLLGDLSAWVRARRAGFAPVLYFDMWIATSDLAFSMWQS